MAAKNHSTATHEEGAQKPSPAAGMPMAQHHRELHAAYRLGAECTNRIGTMLDAAIAIAKVDIPEGHGRRVMLKFLQECEYMSDDLAGMLESERDSQLQYSQRQEGK